MESLPRSLHRSTYQGPIPEGGSQETICLTNSLGECCWLYSEPDSELRRGGRNRRSCDARTAVMTLKAKMTNKEVSTIAKVIA